MDARQRAVDVLTTVAALEAITPSNTHSHDQNVASQSLSFACDAELASRNDGEPVSDGEGIEICDELEDSISTAIKLIRSAPETKR